MKLFLRHKINKVEFFFCFLTNTVFLKNQRLWARFHLPQAVFVGCLTLTKTPNIFLFKFFKNSSSF